MDDMTDFDLLCMAIYLWVFVPTCLWLVARFHP